MGADGLRGQEAGWFKFFHIAVDSGAWARLRPSAQSIYVALGRHTNDRTRICWPGNELLARESGIHVRLVPSATEELVRERLVKKWRKDRKNFYYLYRGEELERLLPGKMDVSTSPHKMDIRTSKRKRNAQGQFIAPGTMEQPAPDSMDRPKPPSVEAVHPSAVESKKSSLRRGLEEEKEKKNTAVAVSENGNYLIPEKLTRTSFYYYQRQTKAHKKPTPELMRWLRTDVRLTEEELRELLTSEYPDWKSTNGEFGG